MSESEASRLMEEGEKQLTKFAPFTSGEEKREKARERFLKAATQYKACSNFTAAAMAYKRAGEMSEKSKIEIDVADDLQNAGAMYAKSGATDMAIEVLSKVVDLYDKGGKYSLASKVCVELGELGGPQSKDYYEKAMTYLRNEGSRVSANDILLKMVAKSVENGDYEYARTQYERIANEYLEENLTRSSARKYFFLSLLCQLAMLSKSNILENTEYLRAKFEEFQDRDPQFTPHTRQHMLIAALLEALEDEDLDAWNDAVADYDTIVPLDKTQHKMLMLGKRVLIGGPSPAKATADAGEDPEEDDDMR